MLAAWRYAYLQPVLLHAACLCSVAALLLAAWRCSACSLLLLIAACVRRDAVVGTRRRPLLPVFLLPLRTSVPLCAVLPHLVLSVIPAVVWELLMKWPM